MSGDSIPIVMCDGADKSCPNSAEGCFGDTLQQLREQLRENTGSFTEKGFTYSDEVNDSGWYCPDSDDADEPDYCPEHRAFADLLELRDELRVDAHGTIVPTGGNAT